MRLKIVVGLVAVQERKLLIVRESDFWTTPGGKREPSEDDLMCLRRETGEELPNIRLADIRFYRSIDGMAPYRGYPLRLNFYQATVEGSIEPGHEILESAWTSFPSPYPLSEATAKVLLLLYGEGMIG